MTSQMAPSIGKNSCASADSHSICLCSCPQVSAPIATGAVIMSCLFIAAPCKAVLDFVVPGRAPLNPGIRAAKRLVCSDQGNVKRLPCPNSGSRLAPAVGWIVRQRLFRFHLRGLDGRALQPIVNGCASGQQDQAAQRNCLQRSKHSAPTPALRLPLPRWPVQ